MEWLASNMEELRSLFKFEVVRSGSVVTSETPQAETTVRLRMSYLTTKSVLRSNHCKDESKRESEDANDETFELTIADEFTNRKSKDSGTTTAFKDMKRRSSEQRAKRIALSGICKVSTKKTFSHKKTKNSQNTERLKFHLANPIQHLLIPPSALLVRNSFEE